MESSFKILLVDDQQIVLDGLKNSSTGPVLTVSSAAAFRMEQRP